MQEQLRLHRANYWLSLAIITLGGDRKVIWKSFKGMDELHDWCGRNSVKKTMLQHEEIFREQVCELHRLYQVQKSLMDELRNKHCKIQRYGNSPTLGKANVQYQFIGTEPKTEYQNSSSSSNASSYQYNNLYPIRETCIRDTGKWFQVREFSSQDDTCCSRDIFGSKRSFDLERPAEEYAGDDVSVASEDIGAFQRSLSTKMCIDNFQDRFNSSDQDTSVELTLSTGGRKDLHKKREWCERRNPELGCSGSTATESRWVMPSNLGWPESIKQPTPENQRFVVTDSGRKECNEHFDRENLQQPPWMFQALPLHRTL